MKIYWNIFTGLKSVGRGKLLFDKKNILITGGTGSLGRTLVKRIMDGVLGRPKRIIIFSRDEAKHHRMKLDWKNIKYATDDIFYRNFEEILDFRIGDVRDYESVLSAARDSDIIIHAAALKQVPVCEYFPYEAVKTNILGAQNISRATIELDGKIETVLAISTDKACKPINTYGMCKAIQERIILTANLSCSKTRFICVRYGNVIASTGSVIPLFKQQIKNGGPLTITTRDMTRFFLNLDQAVDTIFEAFKSGKSGETYIPIVPSAKITDLAEIMIGKRDIEISIIGIRPGEKIHEILVSEEESKRTIRRNNYYVICSILPEISQIPITETVLKDEYSSADRLMNKQELENILKEQGHLEF
ncbi:NAD-dependent epimerase/dehydratase family protein [Candidatus Poribacteria bacterium]|nr:NAD-dependent epimerase/dehydratase family protein [Candidatus Poribacteria bacterium]